MKNLQYLLIGLLLCLSLADNNLQPNEPRRFGGLNDASFDQYCIAKIIEEGLFKLPQILAKRQSFQAFQSQVVNGVSHTFKYSGPGYTAKIRGTCQPWTKSVTINEAVFTPITATSRSEEQRPSSSNFVNGVKDAEFDQLCLAKIVQAGLFKLPKLTSSSKPIGFSTIQQQLTAGKTYHLVYASNGYKGKIVGTCTPYTKSISLNEAFYQLEEKPVIQPTPKPLILPSVKPLIEAQTKPLIVPSPKPLILPEYKPLIETQTKPLIAPIPKPNPLIDSWTKPLILPSPQPLIQPPQKPLIDSWNKPLIVPSVILPSPKPAVDPVPRPYPQLGEQTEANTRQICLARILEAGWSKYPQLLSSSTPRRFSTLKTGLTNTPKFTITYSGVGFHAIIIGSCDPDTGSVNVKASYGK